jgi:hypothetical protein
VRRIAIHKRIDAPGTVSFSFSKGGRLTQCQPLGLRRSFNVRAEDVPYGSFAQHFYNMPGLAIGLPDRL